MTQKRDINHFALSKLEEDPMVKKLGCVDCGYKGFILIKQERGQPMAKRCKCYEEFLKEKK